MMRSRRFRRVPIIEVAADPLLARDLRPAHLHRARAAGGRACIAAPARGQYADCQPADRQRQESAGASAPIDRAGRSDDAGHRANCRAGHGSGVADEGVAARTISQSRTSRHWPFMAGSVQDERAEVHQAIRQGTQPILFASPEYAVGSLRDSLEHAASEARLHRVFIDEAHLVIGWGNGFRPAFQLLPALVRMLRSRATHNGIRVVLASATLTDTTLRDLQQLFGPELSGSMSSHRSTCAQKSDMPACPVPIWSGWTGCWRRCNWPQGPSSSMSHALTKPTPG